MHVSLTVPSFGARVHSLYPPYVRLTYFGPLPPHRGGIAQHGDNLVRSALEGGHSVQRLSWRRLYPRILFRGDAIEVSHRHGQPPRYVADWNAPSTWVRAVDLARSGDVLVMPWMTTFHGPVFEVAHRRRHGLPLVGIVHNVLPHERHPGDRTVARRALGRLDGALVHAAAIATALEELVPGLPIMHVPHPPNLPLQPRPLPPTTPIRLLVFGFVRAYKGTENALDAIGWLRRWGCDARLSVVGQFWEPLGWWEREVERRGLEETVRLDDRYVPDAEVDDLFASHHIILAPYRSATQSGIIPLARAAGRPVVATRVGGIAETVADGHDGYLAPPDDGPAIAAAVQRIVQEIDRFAEASAQRATTWSQVVNGLTDLVVRATG